MFQFRLTLGYLIIVIFPVYKKKKLLGDVCVDPCKLQASNENMVIFRMQKVHAKFQETLARKLKLFGSRLNRCAKINCFQRGLISCAYIEA